MNRWMRAGVLRLRRVRRSAGDRPKSGRGWGRDPFFDRDRLLDASVRGGSRAKPVDLLKVPQIIPRRAGTGGGARRGLIGFGYEFPHSGKIASCCDFGPCDGGSVGLCGGGVGAERRSRARRRGDARVEPRALGGPGGGVAGWQAACVDYGRAWRRRPDPGGPDRRFEEDAARDGGGEGRSALRGERSGVGAGFEGAGVFLRLREQQRAARSLFVARGWNAGEAADAVEGLRA